MSVNTVSKKRGLGRGLNDLGLNELLSNFNSGSVLSNDEQILRRLPIEMLQPGRYQPRRDFDETALQELAGSIQAQGILQPLLVRSLGGDQYEIIAGERRWRAAQLAGLAEVPAIVLDLTDEAAMAVGLIENIQREDLNVIEEAVALQRLVDEFNMTHEQVAVALGKKARSTVTNLLRLLDLEADVRTMLERGDLDMGHARALLALPAREQVSVARIIVAKGLSVREAERMAKKVVQPASAKNSKPAIDPNIAKLQADLTDKLGANVSIQHGPKGAGRLIISYHSSDELEGILAHMT
jgi:ParB family chromosome partitioning protein